MASLTMTWYGSANCPGSARQGSDRRWRRYHRTSARLKLGQSTGVLIARIIPTHPGGIQPSKQIGLSAATRSGVCVTVYVPERVGHAAHQQSFKTIRPVVEVLRPHVQTAVHRATEASDR